MVFFQISERFTHPVCCSCWKRNSVVLLGFCWVFTLFWFDQFRISRLCHVTCRNSSLVVFHSTNWMGLISTCPTKYYYNRPSKISLPSFQKCSTSSCTQLLGVDRILLRLHSSVYANRAGRDIEIEEQVRSDCDSCVGVYVKWSSNVFQSRCRYKFDVQLQSRSAENNRKCSGNVWFLVLLNN